MAMSKRWRRRQGLWTTPRLACCSAPFGMARARLVQHHRGGRALAWLAADGEFAPVAVQDVLDDCQAKARAALLPARRHVDAVEALGQPRQVLRRNARPIVDDGDGV